jgi:ribosomal protein RSM22 (predicted rRNA methylase)
VGMPGELDAAIATWMESHGRGSLATAAQGLSAAYRKGETSSHVSLAAYIATRVPATFAANETVHAAVAAALPAFTPATLLDIGAGPGVASWAAVAAWPSLEKVWQCEQDKNFATLAAALNAASGINILRSTDIIMKSEATLPDDVSADLVVASYMLAELPVAAMAQVATRLWARCMQVLVLIEPGTPQGFARLRSIRTLLLGQGAAVVAPCTHQNTCPMAGDDWCHFKTRVQRSREHMHAKGGSVPFEDEAFSYLVLAKVPVQNNGARIVAPVKASKTGVAMRLCDATGLHDEMVASRDKPTYKRAKKKTWGQVWE